MRAVTSSIALIALLSWIGVYVVTGYDWVWIVIVIFAGCWQYTVMLWYKYLGVDE